MSYVYVYLDSRYPEIHKSEYCSFLYRPIYVGKGTGNRYLQHLNGNKDNKLFESKMQKIRSEDKDIYVIKIFNSDDDDLCYDVETELIICLGRIDKKSGPLCNLNDGGKGGITNPSEETRQKLSESLTGRIVSDETKQKLSEYFKGKTYTEETKEKISNSLKGNIPWNKGKTNVYSDETLCKMRDSSKRENLSKETREKMSKSQKGRKQTEEHKRKNSEANKGRKVSKETRIKMSEAKKKYWENKNKDKDNDS